MFADVFQVHLASASANTQVLLRAFIFKPHIWKLDFVVHDLQVVFLGNFLAGGRQILAGFLTFAGQLFLHVPLQFVIQADASAGPVTRLAAFAVAPGCSAEQIIESLRTRIDAAFLPRPLYLVDALPRNDVGKLPRVAIDGLSERVTAKAE